MALHEEADFPVVERAAEKEEFVDVAVERVRRTPKIGPVAKL
jgi:hypothetical protein